MRKVYIIEYELISPISVGRDQLHENLKSNKCADRVHLRADMKAIPFRKAAEVHEDLSSHSAFESDEMKSLMQFNRKLELLVASYGISKDRIAHLVEKFPDDKTGVVMGIGAETPYAVFDEELSGYIDQGLDPINELIVEKNLNASPFNQINCPYDVYANYMAVKMNARAFQKSVLTACVSSTQAISMGYDSIKQGETEVVIAGGTDSIINPLAIISFGKLGVVAESEEDITCRPFDIAKMGTLAGEAAGYMVLASEDFVSKNNIEPIAEICGYGNTLDGYKLTAPDPEGVSAQKAIELALSSAGIDAYELDYINAHGTGTRQNDEMESQVLKRILKDKVGDVPISSTKSRHGHAIAAAGIQEMAVLLSGMQNDFIPSNLNMVTPLDAELDLVAENRSAKIKYALNNNFSFGGINTVLTLKNLKS